MSDSDQNSRVCQNGQDIRFTRCQNGKLISKLHFEAICRSFVGHKRLRPRQSATGEAKTTAEVAAQHNVDDANQTHKDIMASISKCILSKPSHDK